MFLDTFAWVGYFQGTRRGQRVRDLIAGDGVLYVCPIVLTEITSKYERLLGPEEARRHTAFIADRCAIIDHTPEIGAQAGRIHARMKQEHPDFGLADAFILASARARGQRVLTGDPHFRYVDDAELL